MYEILLGVGIGTALGILVYILTGMIKKPALPTQFKNINLLAVVVMGAVFVWLRNLAPALIAAIIVIYLPHQIAYYKNKSHRSRVLEQLSSAVSLFTNTITITKSIPRSLETVGLRIPDPVGGIFRKAYAELTFNTPLEQVSESIAQRLDIPYGYIFAKLLVSAETQGDAITPLFRDLSYKISSARDQQNFQTTELSATRITNIILLALPAPAYFLLSSKFQEMAIFAASTAGRVIFTLWLLAIILWMFMDRLILDS